MKEIIHEDERIIEILRMFADEIRTCRVSDGEAIDKTACMLTAYMEGMIKVKCIPIKVDPMLEELAGALDRACKVGHFCTHDQEWLAGVVKKYQQSKVTP